MPLGQASGLSTIVTQRQAVRNDPLGPSRLNSHLSALEWLRFLFSRQHHPTFGTGISKGEHNSWEVPRVSRRITFSGGTATLGNPSTDITAVGNPATGTLTLTLASGRFTTNMRLQVHAATNAGDPGAKPRLATHRIISATSVEVYLKELTSALGAGNAWGAVNGAVDVAIHDAPKTSSNYPTGPSSLAFPPAVLRGHFLSKDATRQSVGAPGFHWDDYAYHHAYLRDAYLVEHTTTGEHNSLNIARAAGMFRWKSTSVFQTDFSVGQTLTPNVVSTGIVQLNYTSAVTAAQSFYVSPDWTRADATYPTPVGTPLIINVHTNSSTQCTVYIFAHNRTANTWDRARADFWIALHSA